MDEMPRTPPISGRRGPVLRCPAQSTSECPFGFPRAALSAADGLIEGELDAVRRELCTPWLVGQTCQSDYARRDSFVHCGPVGEKHSTCTMPVHLGRATRQGKFPISRHLSRNLPFFFSPCEFSKNVKRRFPRAFVLCSSRTCEPGQYVRFATAAVLCPEHGLPDRRRKSQLFLPHFLRAPSEIASLLSFLATSLPGCYSV